MKHGLASLVFPGLGQFLLGQRVKGALMFAFAVVTLGLCGVWNLMCAFEAWELSRKVGRGEAIRPFEVGRWTDLLGNL